MTDPTLSNQGASETPEREQVDQRRLVSVSRHAKDRIKERVGVPKKAALSVAQKAFDEGVDHSAARGQLKRWMTKLFMEYRSANNTRIYGNHVFLFAGTHLITVLHLPHGMEGAAKKSKR